MAIIPQIPDRILKRGNDRRKFVFKNLDIKRGNNGMEFPKEGGILTYWEGEKYPWKGYITKEPVLRGPVDVLDTNKAVLRAIIDFATSRPIRYFLPLLLLLPRKLRNKIIWRGLEAIVEISSITLRDYYLEPNLYCQSGREIYKVGLIIIKGNSYAYELLMAICMFWEFSTYYRLCFQDALGEIDKDALLKNPRKELERILGILMARTTYQEQNDKYAKIRQIVRFGSWFFGKELIQLAEMMALMDFDKIKLDSAD
mgnify:CR=1 FL=1